MIIKREDLKKYLIPNCTIEPDHGIPVGIKDIGHNFIVTSWNNNILFGNIKQILYYQTPIDIETNRACIGHYVKLKTSGQFDSWHNGEWARITGINKYTYKIDIEYCSQITHRNTAISKAQIDLYNPFCPKPILVEEAVIGTILTDPINTKPMLQYNHMKKIVDNMMQSFDESVKVTTTKPFDFYKTFDQTPKKQKLNFDVLLNEQKILLDQYN